MTEPFDKFVKRFLKTLRAELRDCPGAAVWAFALRDDREDYLALGSTAVGDLGDVFDALVLDARMLHSPGVSPEDDAVIAALEAAHHAYHAHLDKTVGAVAKVH